MPKIPHYNKPLPPVQPSTGIIHRPVSASDDVKLRALYTQLLKELTDQLSIAIDNIRIDGGEILNAD